jgi:putative effector of murein hydrolase
MNRWPRIVVTVFIAVCVGALLGMGFGGVFGRWAGQTAPDFFSKVLAMPGTDVKTEPLGTATMMGAAAGTVCGGALTVFGIIVAMFVAWLKSRERLSTPPRSAP